MKTQLVIFDCDGVLVDSERIANRVLSECLAEVGLELSFEETIEAFMGRSDKDCLALIAERLGQPVSGEFMRQCTTRTMARFETDLQPILGDVDIPVLVIHGKEDAVVPRAAGHELARRLPRSQWFELESQGHGLPLTAAQELVDKIEPFILEVARSFGS